MTAYSPALERRTDQVEASGKNSVLAAKLVKGADVILALERLSFRCRMYLCIYGKTAETMHKQ